MVTVQVSKCFIYSFPLVWLFFIVCSSTFQSHLFYSFPSTAFVDSLMRFINFFYWISIILIKAILKSLSCASAIFQLSDPTVVGSLDSSGHVLFWLLLIMLFVMVSRHQSF